MGNIYLGNALGTDANVYIADIFDAGTLKINGTEVTSTAAELNILDGVTSTAAELNALDGITATAAELNTVVLTARLPDISTASSVAYVVSPFAGTLSKIYTVINTAITVADATLTANVNGGTNVTATITVAFTGAAAGDVDSCTPADNNTVAVGDYIKLTSNGGSTTASEATVSFVITL